MWAKYFRHKEALSKEKSHFVLSRIQTGHVRTCVHVHADQGETWNILGHFGTFRDVWDISGHKSPKFDFSRSVPRRENIVPEFESDEDNELILH